MADVKVKTKAQTFAALSPKDKRKRIGDILLNNAMYIIILLAVIYISKCRRSSDCRQLSMLFP